MADPQKALESQLRNIQTRTGKSLDELVALIRASGLAKHGEVVAMLKAPLRPIHDALLKPLGKLGAFEAAPKQKYVSYRRKKQFAMIGPATHARVELGLNIKALPDSPRLEKLPAGQMCNYRVKLTEPAQVDAELAGWIRQAYDAAG